MRKFLLLFAVSLLWIPQIANGQSETSPDELETYLKWDFQGGSLPDGFSLFERDGLFYALPPVHFGFSDEKPWIWAIEKEGSNNACLACFPYYMYTKENPRKRSEDWVVTAGIYVAPKEGKFIWKSRSDLVTYGGQEVEKLRGSYNVYVSTAGQRFEDFPETPVFKMEGDSPEWHEHSIDVSHYVGQTIYVAFAGQTINEEYPGLVLIDDLALVGEQRLVQTEFLTEKYLIGNQDAVIRCKYTAATDVPVTSLKASYTYKDQTYSKELSGLELQKGETCTLEFDEKIPVSVSDTARVRVWVEANGIEYTPENHELICLSFKPDRKVVIEDGSGMWCGYCAIGIPAFEKMKEKYPDNFIGIVVHQGDQLELTDYADAMVFGNLPAAKINRRYATNNIMVVQSEGDKQFYTTLNGGIETYFLKELEETVAPASLTLTGGFTDAGQQKVSAKADFKFALDYARSDFRLAFVLIENQVVGDNFYQNNNYASFEGDAGGLENQPSRIMDPVFQEVARGIYDFDGIPGSIPSQIASGETMSYAYEITVPEMTRGPQIVTNNLELVGMIIDATTGQIVNADKVTLGDPQSIREESAETGLNYYVRDGICTVRLPEGFDGNLTTTLIDLNGRTLSEVRTDGQAGTQIGIPVGGQHGVGFLRITSEEKTVVVKIVIR